MSIPELRPYQSQVIDATFDAARRGAHVIVIQSATGSGKSTIGAALVRRAVAKERRVLFIVHRRRLVDQFSERLFDFEIDHGVLMAGHRLERNARVQVASRDTLLSRKEFELPPADLVIVDEGRHACSPEFRRILKPYEAGYTILLDATPVTNEGCGLGPWAQALVVAAKTTELVKDGFLVPVKCFAPDRQGKRGKVRRGIAGDLVASWREYSQGLPTVLFCSRVQHSKDAVAAFREAGIAAEHIDADTKDDDRDCAFAGLETGKVQVVSNVGIAKEGYDIPCLVCCEVYMDIPGRVAFLQMCGRIMRPYPGKTNGILIDHSGAVFKHGFPDEDTEWTLEGNVDADFKKKHDEGDTEKPLYCKHCSLLFHGTVACPQCGRTPAKPPRSVFAPPPIETTSEILTEAQRGGDRAVWEREERIKHWLRCLAVAANRRGPFGMAAHVYKQKYGNWPDADFPCMPSRNGWKQKVAEVYPQFVRRKVTQE